MLGFPVGLGEVPDDAGDPTRSMRVAAELVLLDEQDAPEVFAVVEAERAYLRPWLPWVDQTKDATAVAAYLRDARRRRESGEGFECGVRFEGRIVGVVGVHRVDLRNRSGEIGYWLARSAQGRDLMTRAVDAVAARAFAFGLHRLEIRLWPGNAASRRVAERLGFVKEGVLRDAGWHPDGFRDLEVWAKLAP